MKPKTNYVTPETELIIVRFEKNILSGNDTLAGSAGDKAGGIAGKEYIFE